MQSGEKHNIFAAVMANPQGTYVDFPKNHHLLVVMVYCDFESDFRKNKTLFFLKSKYMLPHIFHIDIYFIFLRERKSAIFRLLINYFYLIQDSRQAPPAVVQTSFAYDDELLLFKQTYLRRRSALWGQ
jgi:hypothetical protein